MAPKPTNNSKNIAENRRARHEYFIEETFEAGIVLTGTEVKALRLGRANIAESYASPEEGGIWLINANVPEYAPANRYNHAPKRKRKLLLHAKEVAKLTGAAERQSMTLVPLVLYFNSRGLVKLKLGLAKGKKLHDKRETEKQRDWDREKSRLLKRGSY